MEDLTMPQVFKIGMYVIYFWANEGKPLEPIHVHVSQGVPSEKLTQKELSKALEYIETNKNDIIAQWYMFFGARN
jgi:hypothetical protein